MYLPSPMAAEVLAGAGFDWIVVDAEHQPFNPETLRLMLMGFKDSETAPLIRVPWNDAVMIKQALDMGWEGVVVPQVNTAEETRRAVAACRYPPQGKRGYGPLLASRYHKERAEYVASANDAVICVIQIEDIIGAQQIGDIVRVPGFDWIFVGRYDMSGTVGTFGQADSPEVWEAVRTIFAAAQAARIPTGNALGGADNIARTLALGCQIVHLGDDVSYLQGQADQCLGAFRKVMAAQQ
jgi:2-keto-3-deoxy-L-rhamnonate aldolase RhmA